MIEFARKLTVPEQKIAHKTIQRNAFYAHPENILRTMLADSDKSNRERATAKIIELQKETAQQVEEEEDKKGEPGEEEDDDDGEWEDYDNNISASFKLQPSECHAIENSIIKEFIVPKTNFKVSTYPDLIDWNTTIFSEPPMTLSLSNHQFVDFAKTPLIIPDFLCHTQAVERTIKLVTEAAGSVIGPEARDGFMRLKIKSRKEVGRCDSKKEFFQKLEKP